MNYKLSYGTKIRWGVGGLSRIVGHCSELSDFNKHDSKKKLIIHNS